MPCLSISLLGSFQVTLDGQPLEGFQSDKARALLAYLAVESSRPQRRERLAGIFWGALPEQRAAHNLNQALSNLRRTLGDRPSNPAAPTPQVVPFFLATSHSVQLNPAAEIWLDVDDFTRLAGEIDAHPHASLPACPACRQRLQQAAALYRGEFLADLALADSVDFDEWSLVTRERLHRLALRLFRQLSAALEQAGELSQALECAWRQVELDALDEDARRTLIALLGRLGQRNAALEQYCLYRDLLQQELAAAPEEQTVALYERLRDQAAAGATTPPAATSALPTPLTPFIGRQRELSELRLRLGDPTCRLLTLLGPGGSGKSRLALEAARLLAPDFTHCAVFVPLNPLTSTDAILPALAAALGLQTSEAANPLEMLQNYLRAKKLLLVLDGFEHLLPGAALLADLLRSAPGLKALVTSRARLNLKGEHPFPLAGLELPEGDDLDPAANEAVQLFLDAARRLQPAYDPSPADLQTIARLCRQVQGMPLAILLAAAWVETLSPDQIAAEVARSLDFLSADWQDQPERQRSLRAAFEHSWNLLSEGERLVFQSLAVFRASFSYPAAVEVCGAAVQELRRLAEKSLLQRLPSGRYQLHELLRQFALEKLAQAEDAAVYQECHCRYYLASLPAWEAALKGPSQVTALAELDLEHENIRAAWECAASGSRADLLQAALEGLLLYYELRLRYVEGESACQLALQGLRPVENDHPVLMALLAVWQGRFARWQGRVDEALRLRQAIQASLDRLNTASLDTRQVQALLYLECALAIRWVDSRQAIRHFQDSQALYRQLGNLYWQVDGLGLLYQSRLAEPNWSEQTLAEVEQLVESLGEPRRLAWLRYFQAFNQLRIGRFEAALEAMQAACEQFRLWGDRNGQAQALGHLGVMLGWHGRFAEGEALLEQALPIVQELGNRFHTCHFAVGLAGVLLFQGKYQPAKELSLNMAEQARQWDIQREYAFLIAYPGLVAQVEGDFQQARERLQQAVAILLQGSFGDFGAFMLSWLAIAECALGLHAEARQHLQAAGEIVQRQRNLIGVNFLLAAAALLALDRGQREQAVELYAISQRHPNLAANRWVEQVVGQEVAAAAVTLPLETLAEIQARAQERDPFEAAAEFLGS
jgi:predicted ATPase/DNA-binding SARP family transcriptional activator/tetratricopeptide (TPR) repeat protein